MPSTGDILSYAIVDDERVVYFGDQDTEGVEELYLVQIATQSLRGKLNADFADPAQTVIDYQISPDGSFVVYRADQDTAGVRELYRVGLEDFAFEREKLNPPLDAGEQVTSILALSRKFAISPADRSVVYMADQEQDEIYELFVNEPARVFVPLIDNQ
jgi:dipeptidyl aminopeptidase/acylaminoacyl peptidase